MKKKNRLLELQKYLAGENITLLGNARSILKKKKDIDKYEIICRMNRGYPQGKENYIGSRTDILFLSTKINKERIFKGFNPKYVIWMTKSQGLATKWIKENAIKNPGEDWEELKKQIPNKVTKTGSLIKKYPSTGILTIQFLLKYINFKSLTIYGFTFFDGTGTWYHRLKKPSWHNGDLEKKIILKWTNEKENVRIIKE